MFLVTPEAQNHQIVRVAKAYAVKKTVIAVNKATVSVDYGALGELDSQLRLKNLDERSAIVQQDYKLLLDNKYHVDAVGDHPASEFVGPSRWRIEDAPPVQWISVNAAIQYVTRMRDSTPGPSIKANADKTLALLAQYR